MKWIKRLGLTLGATAVVALAAFYGYAHYLANREWDAPMPPITADISAAGVARGEAIFGATCAGCHVNQASGRFSGGPLTDLPKFLGSFHSANLTAHPVAGIGARSDAEIARMIRFGITHDGRRGLMPVSGMSDADVAAVLGYIRKGGAPFAPDATPARPSKVSGVGAMLFTAAGAFAPNDIPASGVTAPPKGPTPEYGRYVAEGVFDCGGCHTPGFAADKMNGDAAFAGGFQFADHAGRKIYSANLTFDESGLGGWTLDEFQTTLTTGLRRDGSALRFPMPKYRMLDAVETEAIYRYLQTLPKRHNVVEGRHVMGAAIAATSAGPAQIYARLGCAECHDAGAPYREQLVAAKGKHPGDLARWIRNPEAYKPGTTMPTYAGMLSESDAEKLAAWIVAGGV